MQPAKSGENPALSRNGEASVTGGRVRSPGLACRRTTVLGARAVRAARRRGAQGHSSSSDHMEDERDATRQGPTEVGGRRAHPTGVDQGHCHAHSCSGSERVRMGDLRLHRATPALPLCKARRRPWCGVHGVDTRHPPRLRRRPYLRDRQHDPQAAERRQASARHGILLLTRSLDGRRGGRRRHHLCRQGRFRCGGQSELHL